MSSNGNQSEQKRIFPETRQSMLVRIRGGSAKDLENLCSCYWYPLYAYVRYVGNTPEDSEDLTQGFLAKLVDRSWLDRYDRNRGKLRTFLLFYFKRYVKDEGKKSQKLKSFVDMEDAEKLYLHEHIDELTPERLYDKTWAANILRRVVAKLRDEFANDEKATRFALLQQCLPWNSNEDKYGAIADELGISVGGVKSAVRRMRDRYRVILESEIVETLDDPENLEEEIQYLSSLFAK